MFSVHQIQNLGFCLPFFGGELREALGKKDISEIKSKVENLRNAIQKVGAAIYQQAQQAQAQAQQPPPPEEEADQEKGEKVVDAEYTEEKEEGK